MASLEDPNDPNVLARGQRMKKVMPFMHVLHAGALGVALAQLQYLKTDGSVPLASNYVPTESRDIVDVQYLLDQMAASGLLGE